MVNEQDLALRKKIQNEADVLNGCKKSNVYR